MATSVEHPPQIVITEVPARGGVTGHHVHTVLALGLTGVILAFASIALYAGYDDIQARLSAVMANSPSDMLRACAPYAALALTAAITMGLLLGMWTLVAGRSEDGSQTFMRARVVGQFVLIGVIMALFWMASGA